MSNGKKIVVAGDVTIDWLQWDIKKNELLNFSPNWKLYSGYHMAALPGGAKLLAEMMKNALSKDCISEGTEVMNKVSFEVISQNLDDSMECIPPKNIIHSNTLIAEYEKVYRVKKFNGFCGPEDKYPPMLKIENDDENAEMVIIDDAANGFRENKQSWPIALKNDPIVVLKMSKPLAKGVLWDELHDNHADKLVVIINGNDLRDHGANISKHLSWERTALDFVWEIINNPQLGEFKKCKNLIVRFGIDGAILYQNQDEIKTKLYYDSQVTEDGYKDKHPGDMQGYGNAFVAAIAACIVHNGLDQIDKYVQNGIISIRRLLNHGFGKPGNQPHYPSNEIFGDYIKDKSIYCIDIPLKSKNFWTILESKTRWKLQSVARNYVLNGDDSKLGCVPIGKFEGLKTIDRAEIESYQSIRNIMKEYLKRENPGAPLCIGVFGPPG